MKHTLKLDVGEVEISDAMVAEPDEWIPDGEYNPHNVRPWLIGSAYGPLAVAFGSCEQDALDAAADADKLRGLSLSDEDAREREQEWEGEGVMYLGNAGEPFDSNDAWIRELPNPQFSWVAQLAAMD